MKTKNNPSPTHRLPYPFLLTISVILFLSTYNVLVDTAHAAPQVTSQTSTGVVTASDKGGGHEVQSDSAGLPQPLSYLALQDIENREEIENTSRNQGLVVGAVVLLVIIVGSVVMQKRAARRD